MRSTRIACAANVWATNNLQRLRPLPAGRGSSALFAVPYGHSRRLSVLAAVERPQRASGTATLAAQTHLFSGCHEDY